MSKGTDDIKNIATQTLEGHLRAILGTMTVEDIYQNRDAFASKVQEVAAGDMANMGLGIVSFTIRDIKDSQGYLEALGKPRIAQVKRDAQIAQAEADRDAMIKSSQATQAGQEAKFAADTKIAEAQRDYQMNVATYQASVNLKKAEADLATMEPAGKEFSFFVAYGSADITLDFAEIDVPEVSVPEWGFKEINHIIHEKLLRKVVVVGACTGYDAHTVSMYDILARGNYPVTTSMAPIGSNSASGNPNFYEEIWCEHAGGSIGPDSAHRLQRMLTIVANEAPYPSAQIASVCHRS